MAIVLPALRASDTRCHTVNEPESPGPSVVMLVASKQVGGALSERGVLKQRGHVCIVRLHWAFQDSSSLHMVLDFCPGGDLYDRIDEEGTISLERARLYAAEVTLG